MPGVNRTGIPSSDSVWLGRGTVEAALLDSITGLPTHFRILGNCKSLGLNIDIQTLEHTSSRSGISTVDLEVPLSQKLTVNLTLDHVTDFDNLALFLSGQALKDQPNAARTADVTGKLIVAGGLKGRAYELRNASEERLYDLDPDTALLDLKQHATTLGSATPLAEGPDYTVDRVWGTIFLLSTGAFVDGNRLWFDYDSQTTEQLIDVVNLLTQTSTTVFLRYKGINPNTGKKVSVDLHSVNLRANGDMNLISEDFSEMPFSGIAGQNTLGYPTSPVGRIIYHPDAA